jgi:hypothetical protein
MKIILLTIAILPRNVFEDYLKQVGHTLETFSQGVGGWLLGYIEALKLAGVQQHYFEFQKC